MKKLILFVLLMSIITKHFAQIEKGTTLPGISLQGLYSKTNYNVYEIGNAYTDNMGYAFQAGLNLKYGKFVKNNLLATGFVGYSTNYWKNSTDLGVQYNYHSFSNEYHANVGTIGIGLSKYKLIKDNFYINFGPVFSFSYSEGNNTQTGFNIAYDSLNNPIYNPYRQVNFSNSISGSIYFNMGVNYFITKNLALIGSIGAFSASYSVYPYFNKQNSTHQNSYNVSLLANYNAFSAGLVFFIRPKKDK